MNILHVVERYARGGVERFISTLSSELSRQSHEVFLATGSYEDDTTLGVPDDHILRDLGFVDTVSQTVGSFMRDVERLRAFIERNSIDFVLIHPYYSLFAGIAASKLASVPVAYVAHGPSSMSFTWLAPFDALFQYCLDEEVDRVFAVGKGLVRSGRDARAEVSLLRNPITTTEVPRNPQWASSRRWCLASRIDSDKLGGLVSFFKWLPQLDIDELDVYGSGSELAFLQEKVREGRLADCKTQIRFKGYDAQWVAKAAADSFGVVGYGRVAIEALSVGMPVLLLSLDGDPCGVLTDEMLQLELDDNFSCRALPHVADAKTLAAQLESLYADPEAFVFKDAIRKVFSADMICRQLVVAAKNTSPYDSKSSWNHFVDQLATLDPMDSLAAHLPYLCQVCFGGKALSGSAHLAITASAEFFRHRSDIDSSLRLLHAEMDTLGHDTDERLAELGRHFIEQKASIAELQAKYDQLLQSRSWKIGRMITSFPRWVRNTVTGVLRSSRA